jgi:hypothetical protein
MEALAMDPSAIAAQGVNLENVILGLFMLAIVGLGTLSLIMVRGGFRSLDASMTAGLKEVKDALKDHIKDDKVVEARVNNHAQRLSKIDGKEDAA